MSYYVATINVPGYLPMTVELTTFATAAEAWDYLVREREYSEDMVEYDETVPGSDEYTDTVAKLQEMVRLDSPGRIYGDTPDSDSPHDLGLVYSVHHLT
jgi:hypothetical protein